MTETHNVDGRSVMGNEYLLWREVDRLDGRINETNRDVERLDQYGSRGVGSLSAEVRQLREGQERLERYIKTHEKDHENSQKSMRGFIIGGITIVISMVLPVYPLLIFNIHK